MIGSASERERAERGAERLMAPGQMPLVLAGLTIGLTLMGIQLWLLTIALDLLFSGLGQQIWLIALASGAIFLGGLAMLWLLRRRPRTRLPGSAGGAERSRRR
jgi:hypothetical protein